MMFQGQNSGFTIIIRDSDLVTIQTSEINDIVATLYLEGSSKPYVHWGLNPDPAIGDPNGIYDRNPSGLTSQSLVDNGETGDEAGFEFYLQSADTLVMPAGRYIIQITYNTTNASLTGGENSIIKGALITLGKIL